MAGQRFIYHPVAGGLMNGLRVFMIVFDGEYVLN